MATIISGDTGASKVQTGSINQDDLANNVVGTGPVFYVYQSAAQSIPNSTPTKIMFHEKEFDTHNYFTIANSRFQPYIAGYYRVDAAISANVSGGAYNNPQIFKNGVSIREGVLSAATGLYCGLIVSRLVYLNGATDYIEIFFSQNTGAAQTTLAGVSKTSFQGYLIRPA